MLKALQVGLCFSTHFLSLVIKVLMFALFLLLSLTTHAAVFELRFQFHTFSLAYLLGNLSQKLKNVDHRY
jgi:hypothetical protein